MTKDITDNYNSPDSLDSDVKPNDEAKPNIKEQSSKASGVSFGENPDNEEKNNVSLQLDDSGKDKERAFFDTSDKNEEEGPSLKQSMRDEIEKSEDPDKIVCVKVTILNSDIKAASEKGKTSMPAEKEITYANGETKTDTVTIQMSPEELQGIMDEFAEREKAQKNSLGNQLKNFFGGPKKEGLEEESLENDGPESDLEKSLKEAGGIIDALKESDLSNLGESEGAVIASQTPGGSEPTSGQVL